MTDIHDLASTFFNQADLHPPPVRPPCLLPKWALSQTWITQALAIALILCNTNVVSVHKTILVFNVQSANPILSTFLSPCDTLLPGHWPQTFKQTINYGQFCLHDGLVHKTILRPSNKQLTTDSSACMTSLIAHSLFRTALSPTTSVVICHILASQSHQPNTFWEKMPVPTALNIHMWDHLLRDFDDRIVVKLLKDGWPINYQSHQLPPPIQHNHPSALAFMDHVRTYIKAELSFNAIAGCFLKNPLKQHLICSPLQTILKGSSIKCHVVMDLSYPPSFSVKSGIP